MGATMRQASGSHIGYALIQFSYLADLAETYAWQRPAPIATLPALSHEVETVVGEGQRLLVGLHPFQLHPTLGGDPASRIEELGFRSLAVTNGCPRMLADLRISQRLQRCPNPGEQSLTRKIHWAKTARQPKGDGTMQSKWRKQMKTTIVGAAGIAMAAGGLVGPAVSHAEKVWDIGSYDSCVQAADNRFMSGKTNLATYADEVRFCCDKSGGEWTQSQGCTAPVGTFQTEPQTPGSVRAPVPGKAALP